MADGLSAIGSKRHFEYIVVGCGGIGSGTVYWLSKRAPGQVLGLEQFEIGHERGGSQDLSRIIRLTYQDDRYTRLAPDTYKAWEQVERESGQQLVFKTGGLHLSERGVSDYVTDDYAASMERCNVPFERLTGEQVNARYPQFTVGSNVVALFQKDSGLVDAALGNSTHLQLARGNRAVVIDKCPVLRMQRQSSGFIEVVTTKAKFTCRKLIVTAGAWINEVLGSIGVHVPVNVTQEQVTYLASPHIKDFTKDRFPIWVYSTRNTMFYGLPVYGNSCTKVSVDAGGQSVTANTRTFVPDTSIIKASTDLLEKILPKFLGPEMYTKTCLYTMTPDRHFVVDTCAPEGFPDVIICCGAGHAYKFASLLGKILSEMAVDGKTQYDISQFKRDRQALTDPNFVPNFHLGPRLVTESKL